MIQITARSFCTLRSGQKHHISRHLTTLSTTRQRQSIDRTRHSNSWFQLYDDDATKVQGHRASALTLIFTFTTTTVLPYRLLLLKRSSRSPHSPDPPLPPLTTANLLRCTTQLFEANESMIAPGAVPRSGRSSPTKAASSSWASLRSSTTVATARGHGKLRCFGIRDDIGTI